MHRVDVNVNASTRTNSNNKNTNKQLLYQFESLIVFVYVCTGTMMGLANEWVGRK